MRHHYYIDHYIKQYLVARLRPQGLLVAVVVDVVLPQYLKARSHLAYL